jgi:uncharacterized protein with HEPN domain
MCILQIGELTTNLTEEFLQKYDDIPWQAIRRMRNIAAHHYGKFDVDILWATISNKIPELREFCQSIILKTEQSGGQNDYKRKGREVT